MTALLLCGEPDDDIDAAHAGAVRRGRQQGQPDEVARNVLQDAGVFVEEVMMVADIGVEVRAAGLDHHLAQHAERGELMQRVVDRGERDADVGEDRLAMQLHGEAVLADIRVSLATVYNTLHQFTALGMLREVVIEPGRSYFDTNVSDHHHFFYEDTGILQDIPGDLVRLSLLPAAPHGTSVRRVDVIVRLAAEQ